MPSEPLDDADLAKRIIAGDASALNEVYLRFGNENTKAILDIVRDEEITEDIVIESFALAFRSARSYDARAGTFRNWIASICRNKAVQYLRTGQLSFLDITPPTHSPVAYYPYINSYITYNETRYTFYWYSMFADHILSSKDKFTHGVCFADIVKIVRQAGYVEPLPHKGEHCYRFVTDYKGKTYETYLYLVPSIGDWPARCVVATCYKNGTLRHKLSLS